MGIFLTSLVIIHELRAWALGRIYTNSARLFTPGKRKRSGSPCEHRGRSYSRSGLKYVANIIFAESFHQQTLKYAQYTS
jgi:hypothetical protein